VRRHTGVGAVIGEVSLAALHHHATQRVADAPTGCHLLHAGRGEQGNWRQQWQSGPPPLF